MQRRYRGFKRKKAYVSQSQRDWLMEDIKEAKERKKCGENKVIDGGKNLNLL